MKRDKNSFSRQIIIILVAAGLIILWDSFSWGSGGMNGLISLTVVVLALLLIAALYAGRVIANANTTAASKGGKTKTANYFKLLCGIPAAVALDTHLRTFLQPAGVSALNDHDAGAIISATAELPTVNSATLDASIWSYRSSRSRR